MTKQICVCCYISGKVQGVWFRASAKEQADLLGITGIAANLNDGRVQVTACGKQEDIAKLYEWLQHGPALAKVTNITYEELPWQEFEDFKIQ